MASNELIGISGVFLLTLCLIALYHIIGFLGHPGAQTKRAKAPEQDDPHKSFAKDDDWLLRSPELVERRGPEKPGYPKHPEPRPPGYVRKSR